jgi:polyphosphate kinase
VFYLVNNGDEDVYLSSADWMTRNLDRRVELMFPVTQADDNGELISALGAMSRDNVKSRWLGPDGASSGTHRVRTSGRHRLPARATPLPALAGIRNCSP